MHQDKYQPYSQGCQYHHNVVYYCFFLTEKYWCIHSGKIFTSTILWKDIGIK